MIPYWTFRVCSFLAQAVPAPVAHAIGAMILSVVYYLWPRGRRNAILSMRQVLGPDAPESLVRRHARESFRNYARSVVEFLRFPKLTEEELADLVPDSFGWEYLEGALSRKKGVILVMPHFGSWDLAGAILARRAQPFNAVADSFASPGMNRLVQGARMKQGIQIIASQDQGALKRLYRALARNEVVGIVPDRPVECGDGGVQVSFFGRQARLPAGVAMLALRTGATIIPGFCARRADGKYYGGLYPPIEYEPTGDRSRDIQELTQRVMRALETIIRLHPDQWYMFKRLWLPDSENSHA